MSIKSAIKNGLNWGLGRFGFEIGRIVPKPTHLTNPFELQRELVVAPEPMIFDVGAHVGGVSRLYRGLFPNAVIHSFEPFPESFEQLVKSAEGDSRAFCHSLALSDAQGTAILNSNARSYTNSILKTDPEAIPFWGEGKLETMARIPVPTTTLDDFCRDNAIHHIDILKIDVQGAEYAVFQGGRGMLGSLGIDLIYTEIITGPSYEGQRKFHEYLALLDSLGYDFLDFFNPARTLNQLIQADVVFVSSRFKKEFQSRPNMRR
jgi:FkbM family methyltransferase